MNPLVRIQNSDFVNVTLELELSIIFPEILLVSILKLTNAEKNGRSLAFGTYIATVTPSIQSLPKKVSHGDFA
jgi:hypothetical protein